MKHILLLVFLASSLISCGSCSKSNSQANDNNDKNSTDSKMKIKIGSSSFTATLYDNATVTQFKSLLPLTVNMIELNGNEKYVDLSRNLPTQASRPDTIQNGDLMLYGLPPWYFFTKLSPRPIVTPNLAGLMILPDWPLRLVKEM